MILSRLYNSILFVFTILAYFVLQANQIAQSQVQEEATSEHFHELIESFKNTRIADRNTIAELTKSPRKALPILIHSLSNPSELIRHGVVATLGAIGNESAKFVVELEKRTGTTDLSKTIYLQTRDMLQYYPSDVMEDVYSILLSIAKESENRWLESGAYLGKSALASLNGQDSISFRFASKSLELAEGIGDDDLKARALANQGTYLARIGSIEEATDRFKKSVEIQKSPDSNAVALLRLGILHRDNRTDFDRALADLMRAYRLGIESKSYMLAADTLVEIAVCHRLKGDPRTAFEELDRAHRLVESNDLNSSQVQPRIDYERGAIYLGQGRFEDALEWFVRAEHGFEKNQWWDAVLTSLGAQLNVFAQASVVDEVPATETTLSKADACTKKGFDIIKKHFSNTDASRKELQGDWYYRTGSLLASVGKNAEAVRQFELAEEQLQGTKLFMRLGQVLCKKGECFLAMGDADLAYALGHRSVEIITPSDRWEAYFLLARAASALRLEAECDLYSKQAIQEIENMRSYGLPNVESLLSYLSTKMPVYHFRIGKLIDAGEHFNALQLAEQCKGQAIAAMIASGNSQITNKMSDDEISEEREINRKLRQLNITLELVCRAIVEEKSESPDKQDRQLLVDLQKNKISTQEAIRRTRRELAAFNDSLNLRIPEFLTFRGFSGNFDVDTLRKLVDSKTVIIEYLVTSHAIHCFVISSPIETSNRGNLLNVTTIKCGAKELRAACERLSDSLAKGNLRWKEDANKVNDLLISPIRDSIKGKSKVIIIPDNCLWKIPFQILNISDDEMLVDVAAVSYSPSLSILKYMKSTFSGSAQRNWQRRATVFAIDGPATAGGDARIPHAKEEVDKVYQIYSATAPGVSGFATEDYFKKEAPGNTIIHVAAHNQTDAVSPMYSRIVLAASAEAKDDGYLEARELLKLDLTKTELFVINGCETGIGKVVAGEGMLSEAWVIMAKGCPRTVATLWGVESAASKELMILFHNEIRKNGRAPSEALTIAQRRIRNHPKFKERYKHPFYWASHVLIGFNE